LLFRGRAVGALWQWHRFDERHLNPPAAWRTMDGSSPRVALAAGPVLSLYGVTLSPAGLLVARLSGVALFGYAVLTWFARDAGESKARQAIVLALLNRRRLWFHRSFAGPACRRRECPGLVGRCTLPATCRGLRLFPVCEAKRSLTCDLRSTGTPFIRQPGANRIERHRPRILGTARCDGHHVAPI